MIRDIVFRPEAETDLAEAYKWYEKRDRGLGAELIRSIDSCIHAVQRHPEMYPAVHKNIRQCIVRRFPYSIFYIIDGDKAYVIAVFHAARDPQSWKNRV